MVSLVVTASTLILHSASLPFCVDLLPSAGSQEPCRLMSPGQRFMTDLLVGSLMADGGLEATLDASIKIEMRDIEEKMIEGMCRQCS